MLVSIFVCCALACNWQSGQHYICLIELLPHRTALFTPTCVCLRVCVSSWVCCECVWGAMLTAAESHANSLDPVKEKQN